MGAKKILVVSPHPDDETLGVGGTLLRHRESGDSLYWLIMTNAQGHPKYSTAFQKKRETEIEKISGLYGFKKRFQLPFTTTRLDTCPVSELTDAVSQVFEEVRPDTAYLPNRSDVHSDHRLTFEVAVAATKSFHLPSIKRLLMYETPSETDLASPAAGMAFLPNIFVDITPHLDGKLKAAALYESEMKDHPFPRSLEGLKALAMVRGAVVNVPYAEAFMLVKEIWA